MRKSVLFSLVTGLGLATAAAAAAPPPPPSTPEPATGQPNPPTAATAGTAETAASRAADLNIDIDTNEGDRVYFGEDITVAAEDVLKGDLVVTGGDVVVEGTVTGDVVCTGGNLTLGKHAVVEGDAVVVGGKFTAAPTALVKGQKIIVADDWRALKHLKFLKAVDKEAGALAGRVAAAVKELVFFAFLMFVTLLLNVFVPRHFENTREHLEKDFPRCALLGFAAMIILPVAFAVMLVSIIGIPLIPVAFLIVAIAALAGYVTFARIIGHRLAGDKPVLLQTLVGLSLLQGASLIGDLVALPGGLMADIGGVFTNIGRIVFLAGAFIGIGAVAYSRGGSWTLERTRAAAEVKRNGAGPTPPPAAAG